MNMGHKCVNMCGLWRPAVRLKLCTDLTQKWGSTFRSSLTRWLIRIKANEKSNLSQVGIGVRMHPLLNDLCTHEIYGKLCQLLQKLSHLTSQNQGHEMFPLQPRYALLDVLVVTKIINICLVCCSLTSIMHHSFTISDSNFGSLQSRK